MEIHVVCFIMPLLSISYESLNVQWLTHINEGDPVYCVAKQSELTQFEWKSQRNDKAS